MKKYSNKKNRFFNLYNPKQEGIGSYDINYINAYKKDKAVKNELEEKLSRRYAAWFHIQKIHSEYISLTESRDRVRRIN